MPAAPGSHAAPTAPGGHGGPAAPAWPATSDTGTPAPSCDPEELAGWLRLALTPGVGPAAARTLLGAFGLPEDLFRTGREALARAVGPALAGALLADDPERERAVERALRWAQAPGQHLVSLIDPRYPQRLLQTADPPVLLYVRGAPQLLNRPALAVVGSRSPSAGGAETARAFARALADAGLVIVSGMARGIDAAAHRGGLEGAGGTVAVLGTGADVLYPRENEALALALLARGGTVISEAPLGTGPTRAVFPRRNRLIAGMSLGVLVVEATLHSGSLITARLATEAGREVFAIPGSIHSPLAKGCHQLIKQGAKLVESAPDVLAELPALPRSAAGPAAARPAAERPATGSRPTSTTAAGDGASAAAAPATAAPATAATPATASPPPAGEDSDPLLALLGWDPVTIDTLVARGAGDSHALAARLLELELAGRVSRLADGRYQRRP